MSRRSYWIVGCVAAVLAVALSSSYVAWRAKNTYAVMKDWRAQIRHLVDTQGTIGSAPAATTFSGTYLEAVFGGEPELLAQLKVLIDKGVAEDPTISLGDVTAMIVTYARQPDGKITDVVAHVLGSFSIGKRRPGFHRDGFFASQLDPTLWNAGNTMLGLLGRDMIVFADPGQGHKHDDLMESVLSGNIIPLVSTMTNGNVLKFSAVFPDPKRILPSQLRPHIQACVLNGSLEPTKGNYETLLLTRESKSASYTMAIVSDLKLAADIALKNQFDGLVKKSAWGEQMGSWWAASMSKTITDAAIERQQTVVNVKMNFDRTMVNATLKSLERLGRDLTAMRLVMDEKLDPRLADKQMKSSKPMNYWSDDHQWGPDWPFAPASSNGTAAAPTTTLGTQAKP